MSPPGRRVARHRGRVRVRLERLEKVPRLLVPIYVVRIPERQHRRQSISNPRRLGRGALQPGQPKSALSRCSGFPHTTLGSLNSQGEYYICPPPIFLKPSRLEVRAVWKDTQTLAAEINF